MGERFETVLSCWTGFELDSGDSKSRSIDMLIGLEETALVGGLMVKVRLYGSLRAIAGRDSIDLPATRLDELLRVLKEKYSELAKLIDAEGFIVLVNERPIPKGKFDAELGEDDCVDVLPIVSGG